MMQLFCSAPSIMALQLLLLGWRTTGLRQVSAQGTEQSSWPGYHDMQAQRLLSLLGKERSGYGPLSAAQDPILPAHPRLRLLDKDLEAIRDYIKSDTVAALYYSQILAHGESILSAAPVVRPPPGPTGILITVRVALDRVYTTGLLYRLSQPANSTWLERGWRELAAAVNFTDWNPPHFLDVAEMTHTVAIGYDWFYNGLSAGQRSLLASALELKGFQPAAQGYKDKAFWSVYPDNWNNVCNGAMIVGTLAAVDDPSCPTALAIAEHAAKALPVAMASYGPMGAWPEGVGYWAYATRYTVFAITALTTANKGSDNGLGATPGFNTTSLFVAHATAPSLQFFNYADAGRYTRDAKATDTPSLFYLATRFNQPAAAYLQRLKLKTSGHTASTEDLISYTPIGTAADVLKLPRCVIFPRQNVAMARSAWLDDRAAWLGVKAGVTRKGDPHGHMDIGSYVYEANGHRWAIDLGADSYALPEYFGAKRFTYYRLRNVGHNTLTFDDDNQATDANATLLAAINCPGPGDYVSFDSDLTSAYTPSNVSYVRRHFQLSYSTKELQIFDRIGYGNSTAKTVTWALHTYANISLESRDTAAKLSFGADAMLVSILPGVDNTDCPQTMFSYQTVDLQPPQESTKGVNKLTIQAPAVTCHKLTVSIKPSV